MNTTTAGRRAGLSSRLLLSTAISLSASLALAGAASAQDDDVVLDASVEEAEEEVSTQDKVVVTGSRIQRTDLASVGPLSVIDDQEIYDTGITNVEELLQTQSFSAGFAGNSNAAYWVSGGWGTAQVNLRGLGPNRTLVLLNGWAGSKS